MQKKRIVLSLNDEFNLFLRYNELIEEFYHFKDYILKRNKKKFKKLME